MMRWVSKRKPVKDEKCGNSIKEEGSAEPVKEKSSAEPVKDGGSAEFVEYSVSIKDESSAEPVNYVIYVRPVKKEISAKPVNYAVSVKKKSFVKPVNYVVSVKKKSFVKPVKYAVSVKDESSAEPVNYVVSVKKKSFVKPVKYAVSVKKESSAKPVEYAVSVKKKSSVKPARKESSAKPVKKKSSAKPVEYAVSVRKESSTKPVNYVVSVKKKSSAAKSEKGHGIGVMAGSLSLLSLFLLSACLYDTKISNPDNTVDVCTVLIISALLHLFVAGFLIAKHEFLKENNMLWYIFLWYDCIVVITSSIPLYLKVFIYFFKDCMQLNDRLIEFSKIWMCVAIFFVASIIWVIWVRIDASKAKNIEEISYAQFIVQVALSVLTVVGVFISYIDKIIYSDMVIKYGIVLGLYLFISHYLQLKIFNWSKS